MNSYLLMPGNFQVALVLKQLVAIGDKLPKREQQLTPFHSASVPQISIDLYFLVVAERIGLLNEQALAILILIERFT